MQVNKTQHLLNGHWRDSYRLGIVAAQDAAGARVRVTFPGLDQMQSWWLPVLVAKTQNDKAYHMPDVGEQVVCLMDEHDEAGIVLGAIYSSVDTPPPDANADTIAWLAKDGALLAYDRASHAFALQLPSGSNLQITANGAAIQIDTAGNVTIAAAGQITLGNGNLKGVARLGDTVTCPAGTGTITSASAIVSSS